MADIIIAFPKLDDAKRLKKLLVKNGYDVNFTCDSGAAAMEAVNRLDGGVVVSGYRFSDMYYREIYEYLPRGFQMLLLASPAKLAECDAGGIVSLPMPFRVQDLLDTLEMMVADLNRWQKKQRRPKKRSEDDRKRIAAAKELLMERNQMTEEEAHRYIQQLSMNSATNMAETAAMLLELNGKEWDI